MCYTNNIDSTKSLYYLGPAGSWSFFVAKNYVSGLEGYKTVPKNSVSDIIDSLKQSDSIEDSSDLSDLAVLALESNVEGFVNEVLDIISKDNSLTIIDLKWQEIEFDAVRLETTYQNDIKPGCHIKAHPHALAQCKNFINNLSLIPTQTLSNSAAVIDLKDGELALMPHVSSDLFPNVTVYKQNVQDYNNAKTAFVLLAKSGNILQKQFTSKNSTFWQIIPQYDDKPGTLLKILQLLNDNSVNISALSSRPLKGVSRNYAFYMILDTTFEKADSILKILDKNDYKVRYLGGWNAYNNRSDNE